MVISDFNQANYQISVRLIIVLLVMISLFRILAVTIELILVYPFEIEAIKIMPCMVMIFTLGLDLMQ